tara:strand:+ start:834 stop:1364 length:531 start_codon:yes stop_codon:yes gene_type:complete
MSEFKASFEVKGLKRLRRQCDLNNLGTKPIRKFMRSSGQTIKKRAQEVVPVDTGALQRSIRTKQIKSMGRLPAGIQIKSHSPKSSFVHGDPKRTRGLKLDEPYKRSKPHWPPMNAKLRGWADRKDIPVYLVAKSISEKGTPLVPYLLIAERDTKFERKADLKLLADEIELRFKKTK